MNAAVLGPLDLAIGAGLVLVTAGLSLLLSLGVHRALLWSAARMVIQLLAVGYLLRIVFLHDHPLLTAAILLAMVLAASQEVLARTGRRRSLSDAAQTALILAFATLTVASVALGGIGQGGFSAQQVIPVFGIILGSAMNAASLTLHALHSQIGPMRRVIEARLALGESLRAATSDMTRNAVVSGTIPTLNQMAAAGVITLPGIMSGQILAGQDPMQAALYQIFLMCALAAASVLCVILVRWSFLRRIGDTRDRLRLDRL